MTATTPRNPVTAAAPAPNAAVLEIVGTGTGGGIGGAALDCFRLVGEPSANITAKIVTHFRRNIVVRPCAYRSVPTTFLHNNLCV